MAATHRVWQFFAALRARVAPEEQRALERFLSREQLALFRTMPVNDQRHALNVLYQLLSAGESDEHLFQAALLHDLGKSRGKVGLATRVAVVLLRRVDRRLIARLADPRGPEWRRALYVHVHHPGIGADLAAAAGSPPEVVRLIRNHEDTPVDDLARALHEADEEN